MQMPSLLLSMPIVAATELIAPVPERVARDSAHLSQLQVLAPPIELPDPEIVMVWHERTHRRRAQQWVREQLREVRRDV